MSEWKAKRFWKEVNVEAEGAGFAIRLDGRAVKTPAKAPLFCPTRALAEAVAEEWRAQEDEVDPLSMPFTRTVNAAIDKVTVQFDEVAGLLTEYGGSDLICYRADGPDALIARQAEAWDPLLDWAKSAFGVQLKMTSGIMPVTQDADAIAALRAPVKTLSPFELTALHDLVTLSGSLVIGLAATRGFAPLDDLWSRARVDELWQQEQWGEDEEASTMAEHKHRDFLHAGGVWHLLRA